MQALGRKEIRALEIAKTTLENTVAQLERLLREERRLREDAQRIADSSMQINYAKLENI